MVTAPPRAIALFGTDEPVRDGRTLRAGPLTVLFREGALRHIQVGGREAVRCIAFLMRDRDWGTYVPVLRNLKIGQGPSAFEVSFDAVCRDADQELHYSAKIRGKPDGTLVFDVVAKAMTDVLTNRCGFVVLHPLSGIEGCPVQVERIDGLEESAVFPELIDPACPFRRVRAITHGVLPGVRLTCRMEGEAFETADHRNWNDASFKTYARPLAEPWPYTIKAGETVRQSISLSLFGDAPAVPGEDGIRVVTLSVGEPVGSMPLIGLSLPPEQDRAILQVIDLIRKIAPQFLVCPFDSRIANGAPRGLIGPYVSTFPLDDPRLGGRGEVMAMFKAVGLATGAELMLEAVLACRNATGAPSDDEEVMGRDLEAIRRAASDAGVAFDRVAVSPSSDLTCTVPERAWPPAPDSVAIYDAARAAFPGVPIGGGMFSFFAELNRKRPPIHAIDFICHCSCPTVHAADDASVMASLEAIPHMVRSARDFAGGLPHWVGPSTIGARLNPYGAAPAANPQNRRLALARMDPRQRGLFGAAWTLGYGAQLARAGVTGMALSAPVGEFGAIYRRMDYRQPWFDQQGAGVYPVYHVIRGLAAGAGLPMRRIDLSDEAAIQAVAFDRGGGTTLWIANITGEPQEVIVQGLGQGKVRIATLDLDSFTTATAGPEGLETVEQAIDLLDLGAYAVVRIET